MKSKLWFMFIVLCLAVIGFGEIAVNAQGYGDRNRPAGRGTYRITGKVYLPDGKPAANVTVTASGMEFNGASARTDLDGTFTLSGLSSGNYSVVVRQEGFPTETESLTIS